MTFEYERRFLVRDVSRLPDHATADVIVQGYPFARDGYCLRVRRRYVPDGGGAYQEAKPTLTLKGPREQGRRREYETPVDVATARDMLTFCAWKVLKCRHLVVGVDTTWIVDVFLGANEGLVIAECESLEPLAALSKPDWFGVEVTEDHRYDNEELARTPFGGWSMR